MGRHHAGRTEGTRGEIHGCGDKHRRDRPIDRFPGKDEDREAVNMKLKDKSDGGNKNPVGFFVFHHLAFTK